MRMTGTAVVGRTESFARFVRLFSMGATVSYPLVGIGSSRYFGAAVLGGCVAIGIAVHIHADVGNDVADLPLDATDPRRGRGPLVRGAVRPITALFVALGSLPVVYGLVAALDGNARSLAALSAALLLIALYNVAGKSIPIPAVADLVQGIGWSALVLFGAELAGGATTTTYLAMAYVTAYVAMVNGVHGAVRDLRNDRAHGMRTTALLLGAEVDDGSIIVPTSLVLYAGLLQAGLCALLIAAIVVGAFPLPGVIASIAVLAAATVLGFIAYQRRHDLREAMAMGTWHLALVPAALLALFASTMPSWATAVAIAAFVAPPLLYDRALHGLDFDLPSTIAAAPATPVTPAPARVLLMMTRPGTWLAAAGLTVIGALFGEVDWPAALVAPIAVALIVAAANVFNDRCDVAADRVNRPGRPLATGELAGVAADRFVLIAGVLAVAVAALLGSAPAAVVGVGLVLALAYSLLLRRWLLTGATTVALLFASPLLYGAAFAADGVSAVTWFACVLVFLFVLSREFLMGVPDIGGDRRSGYQTLATVFGERAAYWAFRVGLVVFLVVLWMPVAIGSAGLGYASAVALCACGPAILAVGRLGREPTSESVSAALNTTGLVFGTGLVPLLFLMGG